MKSRFLIFTLFLAVMCIGSASNAMAQSVTGTGVLTLFGEGPPTTITVSSNGGSGGVMRLGFGQTQVVGQPVDQCVQGNAAFVVAQITQSSGDFAGTEGLFMVFGFVDNGNDGDLLLISVEGVVVPDHGSACDLFLNPDFFPIPIERGGFQVKP